MPQDTAVLRRLDDKPQESGILQLAELTLNQRRVHIRRHGLHLRIERIVDNMTVQLEKRLIGYRFTGLLLRTHVNSRQQMMLHTLYLAVRHSLELTHRAEIKDTAEVELVLETRHIAVRRVMQVRRTKQAMRTYRMPSCADDASQIPRIVYFIETYIHIVDCSLCSRTDRFADGPLH